MPFRCKCGRSFEKIDSFSDHTSGCPSYHAQPTFRRNSKSSTDATSPMASSPPAGFGLLRRPSGTAAGFSGAQSAPEETYMPKLMPTSMSLHNTFERIRRASFGGEESQEKPQGS